MVIMISYARVNMNAYTQIARPSCLACELVRCPDEMMRISAPEMYVKSLDMHWCSCKRNEFSIVLTSVL